MKATITGHDIASERTSKSKEKQYVVYIIHCESTSTMETTTTLEQIEWNVYRRYNEFASFHSDLQKVISNQTRNRLKLTKLFPGKFLVGNMRSDKIDKRRHQLQLWLDVIITHPETSKTKLLDDFLQVAKHISTHQNNLAKARSLSISIQPTMSQTLPPPIVHNASSGTDITSSIIE